MSRRTSASSPSAEAEPKPLLPGTLSFVRHRGSNAAPTDLSVKVTVTGNPVPRRRDSPPTRKSVDELRSRVRRSESIDLWAIPPSPNVGGPSRGNSMSYGQRSPTIARCHMMTQTDPPCTCDQEAQAFLSCAPVQHHTKAIQADAAADFQVLLSLPVHGFGPERSVERARRAARIFLSRAQRAIAVSPLVRTIKLHEYKMECRLRGYEQMMCQLLDQPALDNTAGGSHAARQKQNRAYAATQNHPPPQLQWDMTELDDGAMSRIVATSFFKDVFKELIAVVWASLTSLKATLDKGFLDVWRVLAAPECPDPVRKECHRAIGLASARTRADVRECRKCLTGTLKRFVDTERDLSRRSRQGPLQTSRHCQTEAFEPVHSAVVSPAQTVSGRPPLAPLSHPREFAQSSQQVRPHSTVESQSHDSEGEGVESNSRRDSIGSANSTASPVRQPKRSLTWSERLVDPPPSDGTATETEDTASDCPFPIPGSPVSELRSRPSLQSVGHVVGTFASLHRQVGVRSSQETAVTPDTAEGTPKPKPVLRVPTAKFSKKNKRAKARTHRPKLDTKAAENTKPLPGDSEKEMNPHIKELRKPTSPTGRISPNQVTTGCQTEDEEEEAKIQPLFSAVITHHDPLPHLAAVCVLTVAAVAVLDLFLELNVQQSGRNLPESPCGSSLQGRRPSPKKKSPVPLLRTLRQMVARQHGSALPQGTVVCGLELKVSRLVLPRQEDQETRSNA